MPNDIDFKKRIEANLHSFLSGDLRENSLQLLNTLGYDSDKQIQLRPNSPEGFKSFLRENGVQLGNEKKAHLEEWQTVEFLFQLTDAEVSRNKSLFDSNNVDVSETRIESYVFLAIELINETYLRSTLAEITREINRAFPMPVMILFRHGNTLTFSIIDRRISKKREDKDVLQKVTLIKDIRLENPHRAHIEILSDFALDNLNVRNFVELHKAWQNVLDTKELNKKFFQELANWYFWAVENVTFPDDEEKNEEVRNATNVIRLITRLMFVWFLKEKGLVSDKLFDERYLKTILKFQDDSTFYKAILQNLFFATLNSEMGKRDFIKESSGGRNTQHFIHNVFRYKREFIKPDETIAELFEPIPFLNGGLFECLDKETEVDGTKCRVRVDGFSDHPKNVLSIPDELFFGKEGEIDLNEIYGTKNKHYKVRGLINILNSYKFTIAENTPIEEEIALDPELLGKVFENLLASYNPETKTTARKQTGSFYTPREIVNYMVDESLIAYLKAKLQTETEGFSGYVAFGENQPTMFGNEMRKQLAFETPVSNNRWHGKDEELESALRDLFSYTENTNKFNELETEILIKAIDNCKILDPACGSGAFPMGILQRLVFLLKKLDPNNEKWREWQETKAKEEAGKAFKITDQTERDERLKEISDIFENNASDYGRKLFLIENCIYGVDIQPIAIQIAKLRFFISLIVDEKTNSEKENLGIRPLPNLETKFVAANTLMGLEAQGGLKPTKVNDLEKELKEVRAKHFSARTRKTKEKYREKDKEIRLEIADLLKQGGIKADIADQIAKWNPYDQNTKADWFDAEYMFGIEKGFDIVIGNPPYGAELSEIQKEVLKYKFSHIVERIRNSFLYFMGLSYDIAKQNGIVSYIIPNEFLFQIYMTKARKFFLENARYLFALNVGEDVFDAIVPACVISFQKSRMINYSIRVADLRNSSLEELQSKLDVKNAQLLLTNTIKTTPNNIFTFELKRTELVNRITNNSTPFESFCEDVANGISTSCDSVYIVSEEKASTYLFEKEYVKPCIRGGQMTRYFCPSDTKESVLYVTKDFEVYKGRNIFAYLTQNKELLIKKSVEKKKGLRQWHILFRPRYEELFETPKIIFRQTGDSIIAAKDDKVGYYSINSIHNAKLNESSQNNIEFLLGILNSKVTTFYYREISQEAGRVMAEVKPQRIRALPIPKATNAQQTEIAGIVDEIIEAKKYDERANTKELEGKIDDLVYQLYGLTDDEIRIVEGKD